MKENVIKEKSLQFAIRIVNLHKHIESQHNNYVLSKQILKSGTSIGANVREALGAQSKKDFCSKMNIALKEAYETEYWLELLHKTDFLDDVAYQSMFTDCRELTNLLASIVKTTKQDADLW